MNLRPARNPAPNVRPSQSRAGFALALLALAAGLSAQTAPVPKPVVDPAAAAPKEDAVVLSPFRVVSDDKGYQAANTMSGTRLNTKLEDLASSITVITKQQLLDTAAVDINDIFSNEGNTEGSRVSVSSSTRAMTPG